MANFNFNALSGLNTLFQNTNSTSSFLTDYMSIQNGSYKKLLTAYYKNEAGEGSGKNGSTVSQMTNIEKNEVLGAKSDADDLKGAAKKLMATGSKNLFKMVDKTVKDEQTGVTKTEKVYDMDEIAKSVKAFVDSYNKVIGSSFTPSNPAMTKKAAVMINTTKMNKALLGDVGITIGADFKLSLDETKLKNADISTLKTLFNGAGSYASQVAAKAGDISSAASKLIVNTMSGYGSTGSYKTTSQSGSLFNGFI